MGDDPFATPTEPTKVDDTRLRSHGSAIVFAVVALALLLAIIFFYLTNDWRQDRRADKLTEAAGAFDDAAAVVGDAAKNAADALRDRN